MEAPPRGRLGPRLPHRRSKAQRDRQRGLSPTSSSSSSPDTAHWPRPPRKRTRRRKGGADGAPRREEDLIDGFCINSYGSLEAMQRDLVPDSSPPQEPARKSAANKRKRSVDASTDDPEAPSTQKERKRLKKQRCPMKNMLDTCAPRRAGPAHTAGLDRLSYCLDTGYICDAESSCDEQVPGDDLAVSFTVSVSADSPPLSGGRLKLLVLSQISGLNRSCERSKAPECVVVQPRLRPSPPLQPCLLPPAAPGVSPKAEPTPPPRLATAPGLSCSSSSQCSVSKPVSIPHAAQQPTTSSRPVSGHSAAHGLPPVLRAHSHHHIGLFASPAGLPPPPPLLQVAGHPSSAVTAVLSEHDVIGRDIGARFLAAPGGGAELSAAIRPMYQFHQHNHQHTHQHTHQHFTPYPHNVGSSTFEKYPGKMESLYRQNFFPPYSPVITALSPVLPPSVSFGSLQGAFQPKSTNSELASRCSVPAAVSHNAAAAQRSGRWGAMHVRVAYMILRHQERLKLAHETQKCDFRSDLLSCLPSGLGSLSSHELGRRSALFAGAMSHTPSPYQVTPPVTTTFLPPSGPGELFNRTSGFSPLSSLTNGAFGGLGGPPYNTSTIFNQKESPTLHSFPNPHDPWTRLHRTLPTFPTSCPKAGDMDPCASIMLKDEKDRDLLFTRLGTNPSSLTPPQRLPGGDERGPSRTISPYVGIRPGSGCEIKPRVTPDHPPKVKEEPEVLLFGVGRSSLPGLHLPHSAPALERFRGTFLGEQFPHTVDTWRDLYRRAVPPPVRFPPAPPHHLYEPREERAHILREDFERARIYGLPAHVTVQPATSTMLGSLYPHPRAGLLRRTPPINLLSAPPPLIASSQPGSPRCRDFYKERDSR